MFLLIMYTALFLTIFAVVISSYIGMKIMDEPNSNISRLASAGCENSFLILRGLLNFKSCLFSITAIGLIFVAIVSLLRIITQEYKNIEDVVVLALFTGVFFVLERIQSSKWGRIFLALLIIIIAGLVWTEPIHQPDKNPLNFRDKVLNISLYIIFLVSCIKSVEICITCIRIKLDG